LERRGLRSRSLFDCLAGQELAQPRGGEVFELALVVLADVPGGQRLAFPAAIETVLRRICQRDRGNKIASRATVAAISSFGRPLC
jgi:hypothetical protein